MDTYINDDAQLLILELFNGVIGEPGDNYNFLDKYGVLVEPKATHALSVIDRFCKSKKLDSIQLNNSFHKSWSVIMNSSRIELFIHQLLHYATTYGTGFNSSYTYFPDEKIEGLPDNKVVFQVIRAFTREQVIDKCLNLFSSGVALKTDTIKNILDVLDYVGYDFDGSETIKNKEAACYVWDELKITPNDPHELIRYILFKCNCPMVIKNKKTFEGIVTNYNSTVEKIVLSMNVDKMAPVFNRYKEFFMSLKKASANLNGWKVTKKGSTKSERTVGSIINKISKRSKTLHKPMDYNILNNIGTASYEDLLKEIESGRLANANFFQLARALNYLQFCTDCGPRVYNVRNGKTFTVGESKSTPIKVKEKIFKLTQLLVDFNPNLKGMKIYMPEVIDYALPTSEKNYVGNIPMGTKVRTDKNLIVGVYWMNSWGARDIDLSAIDENGTRIGWNSYYCNGHRTVMYSGDITNAPNGACEYMRYSNKYKGKSLVISNVYCGAPEGVGYRIIVTATPDNGSQKYMNDVNNLVFYADSKTTKNQTILGIVRSFKKDNEFILVDSGTTANAVSSSSTQNTNSRIALINRWANAFSLREVLTMAGVEFVSKDECDVDLSPMNLEKDTIINLFKKQK